MSKIIKEGRYPEKNKIICKGCNCEFQYYDTEIITDMTSPDEQDFLGGFGVHKYIKCPQCNEKLTISSEFFEDKRIFTELNKWIAKIKESIYGRFNRSK